LKENSCYINHSLSCCHISNINSPLLPLAHAIYPVTKAAITIRVFQLKQQRRLYFGYRVVRKSSSRETTYRDQACYCRTPLTGFRYALLLNRRSLTEKLVLMTTKIIHQSPDCFKVFLLEPLLLPFLEKGYRDS